MPPRYPSVRVDDALCGEWLWPEQTRRDRLAQGSFFRDNGKAPIRITVALGQSPSYNMGQMAGPIAAVGVGVCRVNPHPTLIGVNRERRENKTRLVIIDIFD